MIKHDKSTYVYYVFSYINDISGTFVCTPVNYCTWIPWGSKFWQVTPHESSQLSPVVRPSQFPLSTSPRAGTSVHGFGWQLGKVPEQNPIYRGSAVGMRMTSWLSGCHERKKEKWMNHHFAKFTMKSTHKHAPPHTPFYFSKYVGLCTGNTRKISMCWSCTPKLNVFNCVHMFSVFFISAFQSFQSTAG